jgi:hypothetical protein
VVRAANVEATTKQRGRGARVTGSCRFDLRGDALVRVRIQGDLDSDVVANNDLADLHHWIPELLGGGFVQVRIGLLDVAGIPFNNSLAVAFDHDAKRLTRCWKD